MGLFSDVFTVMGYFFLLLFKKKSYLFIREREQAQAEGEGGAGCLPSREPNAGLHPRTLGSPPQPKADA